MVDGLAETRGPFGCLADAHPLVEETADTTAAINYRRVIAGPESFTFCNHPLLCNADAWNAHVSYPHPDSVNIQETLWTVNLNLKTVSHKVHQIFILMACG